MTQPQPEFRRPPGPDQPVTLGIDPEKSRAANVRARLGLDSEDYRRGSPTMRLNRAIQHLDAHDIVDPALG